MQLRAVIILSLVTLAAHLQAQISDSSKLDLGNVDVSFLTSYYVQDGNHSPVTGGVGTEKLHNVAPSIIVNVPITVNHSISVHGAVDIYSSASSDNINNPFLESNHVSSASARDSRKYVTLGHTYTTKDKHNIISSTLGLSSEFDVFSISLGSAYTRSTKDNNKEFTIGAKYYLDNWALIYPVELRNGNVQYLNTNRRQTATLSMSASFILTKRLVMSISPDLVYQKGLLSTPFHRVYFQGDSMAHVEQLPNQRIKLPVGVRLNYYANDYFLFRFYYRFYWDSWNIRANTVQLEIPIKITDFLRIYPFYRFHIQTAASYFAPYAEHLSTDPYFTSDYDLSGFMTHKIGAGISIMPLYGVMRYKGWFRKDKITVLKSIDLRYAHYFRTDGFKANVVSLALNFTIPR